MRKVKDWRRIVRPVICFGLAVLLFRWETTSLIWFGFFLLALWFIAVDLFSFGEKKMAERSPMESANAQAGVLGTYLIDGSESYGMFIRLSGAMVFIDIRPDRLLKERERHAQDIFAHVGELEKNFNAFIEKYAEYKSRHIVYIGLHSDDVMQGEVFWFPSGYTILRGREFFLE